MMETKFAVVQYQEGQHVMEDKYSWTPLLSRIFTEWFGQCVKSLPNRSYSGPYFSCIFSHSDWIRSLSVFSPNAGKRGKNDDQNNSEYGHFLPQWDAL